MEKMTFRQKIENFWYHNKFAVIVSAVFIIFITISLVQILTKPSPDANFLYMGHEKHAFYAEDDIQDSIAKVMKEDYNKDGKKYIDYIELVDAGVINDTEGDFATGYTSMYMHETVGQDFAAHIIAGDSMIYLLDESYYKVAKDTNVLMPLSEALGYTPDFALNEYAVYLSDLDISYLPGFKELPDSILVCIRYPVTLTAGKKKVEEREQCNLSVFRDMFSYVHPDKPEDVVLPDPTVMTLDEFKTVFAEYSEKNGLGFSEAVIRDSAADVSPEGFFEETGANLFRVGTATYLAHYGKLYALGEHFGGTGMTDIATGDFDADGQKDILIAYSFGSGKNSIAAFNLTTKKQTFLKVESGHLLTFKKLSDVAFEIYGEDVLVGTVEMIDGEFKITFKDV